MNALSSRTGRFFLGLIALVALAGFIGTLLGDGIARPFWCASVNCNSMGDYSPSCAGLFTDYCSFNENKVILICFLREDWGCISDDIPPVATCGGLCVDGVTVCSGGVYTCKANAPP
jgi:hypothetical protein